MRGNTMTRKAISTDTAPCCARAYSHAIVADNFVFCSGTAGIDPATGAPGDSVEAQTQLALRNLEAILTAAGASLPTLVKTTIFYINVEDFATIKGSMRASCPTRRQPAPHRPTWRRHTACLSRSTLSPCFRLRRSGVTRQTGAPETTRTRRSEHRYMHSRRSCQPFRIDSELAALRSRIRSLSVMACCLASARRRARS
jgi:2-iminobutanoate/2-iminopropanoate deaminase